MKNKKGFTLVELLVSLGLFSIIFSLTMMIYITNYKNYKFIKNDTELQFQAQYILNFMSNKIIDAKYIEQARDNKYSFLKKSDECKISKISFCYGSYANKCYNFEIKNNKIFYGNALASTGANVELGSYVSEIFACPVPDGINFENAEAVKIRLKLEKEKQSYEAEQTIFMRNN